MQTFDGGAPAGDRGACDQLTIVVEPDPQGVRVRLVGEVDLATAPELDRVLDELAGNGHSRLLIDLEGVGFLDSTGIGSLFRALRCAEANGHGLTVRRGSPQVQRLFELTGMTEQLTFED